MLNLNYAYIKLKAMDTFILFFEIISIVILLIDLNKKVVPSSKIINGGDYSSVSNYFLLKIFNYMFILLLYFARLHLYINEKSKFYFYGPI